MAKKKTTVTRLQSKSDNAVAAFMTLVAGLKNTNEEADAVMAINASQIEALQAENEAIAALSERNAKIVRNVEKLLEP